MKLFCSNCGTPLHLTRKAIKNLGIIVDIVDYHECSETIIPFDISNFPEAGEFKPVEGKNKFVESLNGLKPSTIPVPRSNLEGKSLRPSSMTGTDDLRDRRFEDEKVPTTAPSGILDQLKQMSNSIPANDIKESDDSEMGG
jgi:hypothetical protein